MITSNYHTHTIFSDGKGTPEECILSAIEKGFSSLGFSDHQSLNYPNDWTLQKEDIPRYFREISLLKEKYRSQIEIYTGIELDYHKNLEELFLATMTEKDPETGYLKELLPDFTIGSVHSFPLSVPRQREDQLVTFLPVDGPEEIFQFLLKEEFDSDINKMIESYFAIENEMIAGGGFDIIGHLDLIKKHNRGDKYFSENSQLYRQSFLQTLDVADKSGIILELNTGGIARGKTDTVYPSPEYLKEAFKRDIPVIISSDSHEPSTLDFYFKESEKLLWDIGYRETAVLEKGKWIKKKIKI